MKSVQQVRIENDTMNKFVPFPTFFSCSHPCGDTLFQHIALISIPHQ